MQLGMIGLGRMGGNIVRRLMRAGHSCVVFDKSTDGGGRGWPAKGRRRAATSPISSASSRSRARSGSCCRPVRSPTSTIVECSAACSKPGDILIDGGNSHFHDDVAHAEMLQREGHPLSRCRHQRRRLGSRARLLHDDRRRQGGRRASRPDLRGAGAGRGDDRARRRAARGATRGSSRATSIAGRRAPGISSRWSTTASSTG